MTAAEIERRLPKRLGRVSSSAAPMIAPLENPMAAGPLGESVAGAVGVNEIG
jgi:hypothetical protein